MKGKVKVGATVFLALLAVLSPAIAWRLQRVRTLDVVVLDKTVPFEAYREHAAIPWLLHSLKIQDSRGRFLDPSVDYVGYDPKAKAGHDLQASHLARADVLVIADTYGVYRGDYERGKGEAALERSPKIFGGLSEPELVAIDALLARGGMVLAEFNAFASPTEPGPRSHAETIFGARWTRWVGRYWADLQDPNEVPRWVGTVWERVTKTPFVRKGGGFVFVREDEDIVVLGDEDLERSVIGQERTANGAAFDFPLRGAFRYWMDVLEATDGEVLYEHVVAAKPSGLDLLARHGLKPRFPALVRRRNAWYFAGDFVDSAFDLGSPELAWALPFHRTASGCGAGSTNDEAFFWGFYAPIVSRLFSAHARGAESR